MIRSICVFCGSSSGAAPVYQEAARAFAVDAAERGIRLVYGGASVGLMLDAGGYYSPLIRFLDHAGAEGFIRPAQRGMLVVERDATRLIDKLVSR